MSLQVGLEALHMYLFCLAEFHAHKSQVMWAWGAMTGQWK